MGRWGEGRGIEPLLLLCLPTPSRASPRDPPCPQKASRASCAPLPRAFSAQDLSAHANAHVQTLYRWLRISRGGVRARGRFSQLAQRWCCTVQRDTVGNTALLRVSVMSLIHRSHNTRTIYLPSICLSVCLTLCLYLCQHA